jgi:protein subunit release factor A
VKGIAEEQLLHVWLISAESDERLFDDVRGMLDGAAQRARGQLVSDVAGDQPGVHGRHYLARITGRDTGRAIMRYVGVHRGQIVPIGSSTGRVETTLVGVEVLEAGRQPSTCRPAEPILRTYNYVLRAVTHHATGHQLPLDRVLSGEL